MSSQRNRRDSYASTISNITCASHYVGSVSNNNDYKENKAYELRKKSNLMNKISVKTQAIHDPIYSRAHPSCFSSPLDSHEETSSTHNVKRRLFAKKNEKFDANLSLGSNGSSKSSHSSSQQQRQQQQQQQQQQQLQTFKIPNSFSMNFRQNSNKTPTTAKPTSTPTRLGYFYILN